MSNNNTVVGQANAQAILDMLKQSNGKYGNLNIGSTIPGLSVGQVYPATGAAPAYAPNASNFTLTGAVSASNMTQNWNANGLELHGEADIKFGNISLKDFMEKVSLRLNMMVPHPELEKQWDELRTLGEAYRACEKECLDKAKVWDILKRD